tara:strand:+ start:661 stop:1239 length:579 start_codon:yes stop_codon:yes gene_type:complete
MSYPNSLFWDSLEPKWVNLGINQTLDEKVFTSDYGTKITSQNGNNGASASGRVKGVAPLAFVVSFKLGYQWGWSSFYACDIKAIPEIGSISGGHFVTSGYNGMRFINNSSNNKLEISKGVGTTATLLTDITGVNDTLITMWRDTSGVVKYKVGSASVVTVGTLTGDWTFFHAGQSPCSCQMFQAHNDSRGAS